MLTIVTRADDCGSSQGANQAIFAAADAGFIKNISLMACGDYIEEAAEKLSHREDICFGMHFCMNSEWNQVKFKPVSSKAQIPLLLNTDGEFYSSPADMVKILGEETLAKVHKELLAQIYVEWKAQLTKLQSLGFKVSYADTHMLPELHIPFLKEVMRVWMAEENLVDHHYFYNALPHLDDIAKNDGLFESVTASLGAGQYFYLVHPAAPTQDMYLTGNVYNPTEKVVADREKDYQFVTSEKTIKFCRENQIKTIRYDEANKFEYESICRWIH